MSRTTSDTDDELVERTGVCVITGGGRGIGAAVARRLAAARPEWVQVLSWVTNRSAADAVAADITSTGAQALSVRADVSSESDVTNLFAVADSAGPVRALVNNAGILGPITDLDGLDAARINQTLSVNVTGTILCAREAVRRMSTTRGGVGGAVVNVSSRAAQLGSPGEFLDYAASKGAVDTFTVGLAAEVATAGIRVNGVRPGLIDTDIHASAGQPDRIAAAARRVPMGRGGSPDEVAAAVVWLLSDDASYVTGALLDVGGGR